MGGRATEGRRNGGRRTEDGGRRDGFTHTFWSVVLAPEVACWISGIDG